MPLRIAYNAAFVVVSPFVVFAVVLGTIFVVLGRFDCPPEDVGPVGPGWLAGIASVPVAGLVWLLGSLGVSLTLWLPHDWRIAGGLSAGLTIAVIVIAVMAGVALGYLDTPVEPSYCR